MLHENDVQLGGCEFAHFIYATPDDLLEDGIFNDVAIALFSSARELDVSRAYALKALAGTQSADGVGEASQVLAHRRRRWYHRRHYFSRKEPV